MGCIDPEKLNIPIFDINRPISIPIRNPYELNLSTASTCPENNFVLYKEAKQNNYRMGGIILDNNNTIICNVSDNIFCDILQASYIVIENSELGIGGGEYISLFADTSIINTSDITADVVLCYDSEINDSGFNLGATINIMNGNTSIKNSSISSDNFLTIMADGRNETIIDDSSILINYYTFADKIKSSGSSFHSDVSVFYDSEFKDCELRLKGQYNANDPKYLQPGPIDLPSFKEHTKNLYAYFTILSCTNYTIDDQGLITGCTNREDIGSPGSQKLYNSMIARDVQLEKLESVPSSEDAYKQSAELLDGATQMFEWLAADQFNDARFKFSTADNDFVGVNEPFPVANILKKCELDNTKASSSSPLILDRCTIKNSIIKANEIVSREISLSKDAENNPVYISYYDRGTTMAYIGNSTYNPEKPEDGPTSLEEDSHIITEKWFGEVSIGSGCSITCTDFFAEYCEMHPKSKLILNSEHITVNNLGLEVLPTEATLEVPNGTLYMGDSTTINGLISGSSITIYASNAEDILSNGSIQANDLNIRTDNLIVNWIQIAESLTLNVTNLTIASLLSFFNDPINIIVEKVTDSQSFLSNLDITTGPSEVILRAENASVSLGTDINGESVVSRGGSFNNSELRVGTLVEPSLSDLITNNDLILRPTIENPIRYIGKDGSKLIAATFPEIDDNDDNDEKIRFEGASLIANCIIPSGYNVFASELIISGGKSDIADINADKIHINSDIILDQDDPDRKSLILSYGKINEISFAANMSLFLLELNNIQKAKITNLSENEEEYLVENFTIKDNSSVGIDDSVAFENLILLEKSRLSTNSPTSNITSFGGPLECFLFNINDSTVAGLIIYIRFSINTFLAKFETCKLQFSPVDDYNYYIQNTQFHNSQIGVATSTVLGSIAVTMNDCVFVNSKIESRRINISAENITFDKSENFADIECVTFIMTNNSRNFATIRCENLIWKSSSNYGRIIYDNAIEIDDTFSNPE